MPAAAVERASWRVGMPVGPLAVQDEVTLTLIKKAHDTHLELDERLGVKNGFPAINNSAVAVGHDLIAMGRTGRKAGAGFYDYHADGSKSLWPGLTKYIVGNSKIEMQDAEDRLLYRQAIETLRCYNEGVLISEAEANIGSIFGIGFPAWTGGALQYIRLIGVETFAARAAELADAYGPRFALPADAFDKLRVAKVA
ncbi:MAG: 3-hydroxyacyl-CoA dehydrogenase family protein, partial [Sulfitobacter sp.]